MAHSKNTGPNAMDKCDCLNWCGDDPFIREGKAQPCESYIRNANTHATSRFLHTFALELLDMSDEDVLDGRDPELVKAKGLAILAKAKERVMSEEDNLRALLEKRLQTVERDNKELREEVELLIGLNERLGKLLDGVCYALKGKPSPNTAHSWHDLPELAVLMKAELNELKAKQ